VLGNKLGMLTQTVARALDLDHNRMVKKAIQKCRGHNGIAKNLAPLCGFRRNPDRHSDLKPDSIPE
jgi:hypothetical protein